MTNPLDRYVGSQVLGWQYIVIAADGTRREYAGGWADIRQRQAMTLDNTMMAYSMTKTFTAVGIMQLVEQEKLELDDEIDRYLPDIPYRDRHITIRQLLAHTAGIPNPIPLRWVHLAAEDANFDEDAALAQVLRDNPKLAHKPGQKFAYSNIGYWLLGKIIDRVTGSSYRDYTRANILLPLSLAAQAMDFVIPDLSQHAMRIYPTRNIASVVMVNGTNFNSTKFLNRMDKAF